MDPSLKPDPNRKGSYFRRIQDIQRAIDALDVGKLPETIQFIAYYFACEKLAYGIVGIHKRLPADDAFLRKLKLNEVMAAATELCLRVQSLDLEWLFADHNEQSALRPPSPACVNSARYLRNKLGHQFGPTHVAMIREHAQFHNPRMQSFLGCAEQVIEYQRIHFSHIA